jgi:hypothetical protein
MRTELAVDFMWIPHDLGGHHAGPYSGMRLTIRWQRHLDAYLQCARDIECELQTYDANSSRGKALCTLVTDGVVPADLVQEGELVELLNGFRVLAVGKITLR